jgi:hypothetical protein
MSSLSYAERLVLLDLELIELRRLRFDLIYHYKVTNHSTPFNPSDVLIVYSPDARSRYIHPYLRKSSKATNRLPPTFFFRSVDAWNALPPALRSSSILPAFMSGLNILICQPTSGVPLLQSKFICYSYMIIIYLFYVLLSFFFTHFTYFTHCMNLYVFLL